MLKPLASGGKLADKVKRKLDDKSIPVSGEQASDSGTVCVTHGTHAMNDPQLRRQLIHFS
jgi:hypothetical protein